MGYFQAWSIFFEMNRNKKIVSLRNQNSQI